MTTTGRRSIAASTSRKRSKARRATHGFYPVTGTGTERGDTISSIRP